MWVHDGIAIAAVRGCLRLVGLLLLAMELHAGEPSPLIQNPEARSFVSLNGSWKGVISSEGDSKLAFDVLKEHYARKPK